MKIHQNDPPRTTFARPHHEHIEVPGPLTAAIAEFVAAAAAYREARAARILVERAA